MESDIVDRRGSSRLETNRCHEAWRIGPWSHYGRSSEPASIQGTANLSCRRSNPRPAHGSHFPERSSARTAVARLVSGGERVELRVCPPPCLGSAIPGGGRDSPSGRAATAPRG